MSTDLLHFILSVSSFHTLSNTPRYLIMPKGRCKIDGDLETYTVCLSMVTGSSMTDEQSRQRPQTHNSDDYTVLSLKPGNYWTSYNQPRRRTTVHFCKPGGVEYDSTYYVGRCEFEDAAKRLRHRPAHDRLISFSHAGNHGAVSATHLDPNANNNNGSQKSLTPPISQTVAHLIKKVEGSLRQSFQSIRTSRATADDDSQKTQGPNTSSHSYQPTSGSGRLTGEYGPGQEDERRGDEHSKYTQATTGQRGGVDDGSRSDCKSGAQV
jgi:hypothetical protein